MIDRHGQPLALAWSEYEILWVRAANTLTTLARDEALREISEWTGRSWNAVEHMARRLNKVARHERFAAAEARRVSRQAQQIPIGTSGIRPPTKAMLMAGRA